MTAKDLRAALLQEAVQGKLVPPACRQAGKLQAKIPCAKEGQWFVYVIECQDGSFYKGFTTDLQKRYEQHCKGIGAEWTRIHKPKQLFYWEIHYSEKSALEREKYLKSGCGREWFKKEVVDKPENWQSAHELLLEIRKKTLDDRRKTLGKKNAVVGKKTAVVEPVETTIPYDEKPFDIPQNWCWCRLGEICELTSGQDLQPDSYNDTKKGIPYITGASNFENNQIKINRWTETPKSIALKDDLLLTCKGTVGEMAFLKEDKVHIARQVMSLRFDSNISSRYARYYLSTQIENLKSKAKSMIPGIARNDVISLDFPLPPLAEQKRIVAALEKMLPLVEEYGKKEEALTKLNADISALAKKAVLQEAVQGKLVPQIESEGNARDLLAQIRMPHGLDFANAKSNSKKIKTKKETALAVSNPRGNISDEEKPFDIPRSWCWCRIEDITKPVGNKNNQIQTKAILKSGKVAVVSQGQNLIDGFTNETEKTISELPLIMFGDHTRNVKYIDFPFVIGADGTKFFKAIKVDSKYLYYLISFEASQLKNRGYARHYSLLKETMLPLPPLAEQKRIVSALEKILPLCEKLGK